MKRIILFIALGLAGCAQHSKHKGSEAGIDLISQEDGPGQAIHAAAATAPSGAAPRGVVGRNSALIWITGGEGTATARTAPEAQPGKGAATDAGRKPVSAQAQPTKTQEKSSERGGVSKPVVEEKEKSDEPQWMRFVDKPGAGAKQPKSSAGATSPKAPPKKPASAGGDAAKAGKSKGSKAPSKGPSKKTGRKGEPVKGDRVNEMQSSTTERVIESRPMVGTDAELKTR